MASLTHNRIVFSAVVKNWLQDWDSQAAVALCGDGDEFTLKAAEFTHRDVRQALAAGPDGWDLTVRKCRPYLFVPFEKPSARLRQWISSRQALRYSIMPLSKNAGGNDRLVCSLAHCDKLSAACSAVRGSASPLIGVGVDVEHMSREVSLKILNRVAADGQPDIEAPAVVHWVAKEAAFKSVPQNTEISLKDVWFRECLKGKTDTGADCFWFKGVIAKRWPCRVQVLTNVGLLTESGDDHGWVLGIAFCLRRDCLGQEIAGN